MDMDLDTAGPSTAHRAGASAAAAARKSVPYGQACTNCSKAKCKCIVSSSSRGGAGSACERCQRLGKECVPSVSVRKRAAATRKPAVERTAHLEEKLDDLVSILRAQAASNPTIANIFRDATTTTTSEDAPGSSSSPGVEDLDGHRHKSGRALPPFLPPGSGGGGGGGGKNNNYAPASYPTPPSVASSSHDLGFSLPPAEAEDALREFREDFLSFFPFMYIPPETTAAQIQQEKPFLWLNIMVVCCKSATRKAALAQRVREIFAQKMLLDMDRNMDLLLGILAYLGWGMHHFNGKPYIVSYMNLAMTIITDLRLDKPPQDHLYREIHCFKPSYQYPNVRLSTDRTHEERRAVLACSVLCSGISAFIRTQPMRWTSHMEDSLQKLAANPECLNDSILVFMTRVFRIHEDVAQITWRSVEPFGNALTKTPTPPVVYAGSLRAGLEAAKKELPRELVDNKVVLSYMYITELCIADMSLWNVNPWLTTHPMKPLHASASGSSGGGGVADLGKLDAYYSSLQASKAVLDNFLGFTPSEYLRVPFSMTLHFGRASQTVYRLLLVDDPDWDRAVVRRSIDLMAVMERVAARYEGVHRACGFEPTDDPDAFDYYSKAAAALRATIPAWSASIEQANAAAAPAQAAAGDAPPAAAAGSFDVQFPIDFTSMEWLDDPWLTSNLLQSFEGGM
ncbi:hypothetical protein GGR52DRAFT_167962 [Hypoxylon sp. FL1284]|nr:hypothetical protein GGR52DRAFT_167962 [Hypoxylon sp. FL1284]